MDGVGAMVIGNVDAVKSTSSKWTKRITIERMIDGCVVPVAVIIHAYSMLVVLTVDKNCSLAEMRKHV
jgi:hypothetical protein